MSRNRQRLFAPNQRGLPVLVLKSGRTAAGRKASLSHTGSLATEDRVVDAFLEFHGLHRVAGMGELVHAAELYLRGWKADGRRMVVISNSGTACVLAADAASSMGIQIHELHATTRAELAKVLPQFATTTNPVDITAALLGNSRLFGDILPIIARDPGADVFLISVPVAGRGYDVEAFARDAAAFAAATAKPVVIIAPQPKVARKFRDAGLPVFAIESDGVKALEQFISAYETLNRARAARGDGSEFDRPAQRQGALHTLNEAEGLMLAKAHGISVIEHCLCQTEDDVAAALSVVGGVAAVKGCSRMAVVGAALCNGSAHAVFPLTDAEDE